MKNRIISLVIVGMFLICAVVSGAPAHSTHLTIIASGETHGMLYSCDCPREPGGGLPKRATVIRKARDAGPVLVLDAGGFSGGGMYDTYTEGRRGDSVRTLAAIAGMSATGYDAVCAGDEELQYGARWLASAARQQKLPVVSANCVNSAGKPVFAPYVLVKKGSITIAVAGVTTTEALVDIDSTVTIQDPFRSLRAVWKEMVAHSDVQVVLSHCGDEISAALADSFSECDLVVNGHRKLSTLPVVSTRGAPVMEFGFQGKSVSSLRIDVTKSGISTGTSSWLQVTSDVADDSTVHKVVARYDGAVAPALVYDLYIMSQCPYGIEALPQFLEFANSFTDNIQWNIRFIGGVGADGTLTSLHGPGEVEENKIWLAIEALYPGRWQEFLRFRSGDANRPVREIIRSMKLDQQRINAWISTQGNKKLAMHFLRSMRIGANASPMLFINNTQSELAVQKDRLAREQCSRMGQKPRQCDSLPVCIDDTDCKAPGKVGKCDRGEGRARCVFRDALVFTFTVVAADSVATTDEESIIETTRELFPGVKVDRVIYTSEKGSRLVQLFKPRGLPLYLFDKTIAGDDAYARISSGLIPAGDYLGFRDKVIRPTYYHTRTPDSSLIVFVDPVADNISEIIDLVLSDTSGVIQVRPVIYADPGSPAGSADEKVRREEAVRWVIMARDYPKKYQAYLREYARMPGSSYWFTGLRTAGVNLDEFTVRVMQTTGVLDVLWKDMVNLDIREPAVVLMGNRKVMPVRRIADLGTALAKGLRYSMKEN